MKGLRHPYHFGLKFTASFVTPCETKTRDRGPKTENRLGAAVALLEVLFHGCANAAPREKG